MTSDKPQNLQFSLLRRSVQNVASWFYRAACFLNPEFYIVERNQLEALRESNEYLENLFNYANVPIIVWDTNFNITRFNSSFEVLTGRKAVEVIGKNIALLFPDDLIDSSMEHISRTTRTGERWETIEIQIRNVKGFVSTVLWNSANVYAADGKTVVATIAQGHDITKRLLAEQQFQQAQRLESLGVLAGGIAHDFNNLMSIILGHCSVAVDEINSGLTYKANVQQIEVAAHQAAELCQQMLAYAGKSSLVQTQINMQLIVEDIVRMLQQSITKNVTIELSLNRNIPEITADSSQIQQIAMNLFINAAEAIGDNNGAIRVVLSKISVQPEHAVMDYFDTAIMAGNYVCLEVSDTGCGMDEKTKKRLFEPFYTTKLTGRGLGMSALLGIIKAHKGALQLSSTVGVGTTFKIYLPMHAHADAVETVTKMESRIPSAIPGGTVLLVDDEPSLRSIGSVLLSAMGYTVITALNGREAIKRFKENAGGIHLILMDMVMPEMGGVEAYRELRIIDPLIPVVFCRGCNDEDISAFIDGDRNADVIQKPYKPEQLGKALTKMILSEGERYNNSISFKPCTYKIATY